MKPRIAATRALVAVTQGRSLNRVLPETLEKVAAERRPLVTELVNGTLREWPRLEAIAAQRLERPLKAKDADIQALIIMGLYQLDGMRIPPHAAVSETVSSCAALRKGWARGLVNGVLRGFQRDGVLWQSALTDAQRAALPDWWWRKLGTQWPDQRADIAEASRLRPPMTLRVNVQRTQRDNYQQLLAQAGINAHPVEGFPDALVLEEPVGVEQLPAFAAGWVSVQDAAAQLAAPLLAVQAGEKVLDACAAPGGKTCHIAEHAPDALITAADSSEHRLHRVRENIDRLGVHIEVRTADAAQGSAHFTEQSFDAILADVPCSATGVGRRNPDIKVLRNEADLDSFASQQLAIVTGLWPLLRPGGRLLYVTCSTMREENDAIVTACLGSLEGAECLPVSHPRAIPTETGCQLLPCASHDGLFFAMLRKCP